MNILNPTVAEINLESLAFNLSQIKKLLSPSQKLLSVVKANAYGHGYVEVAKKALQEGASFLGVVSLKEASILRESGISKRILVLGSLFEEEVSHAIELEVTPVIFSIPLVKKLNLEAKRMNKQISFHIEIETGMGRLGISPDEIETFLSEIKKSENLKLEGVMTHFAQSEAEDSSYTRYQLDIFRKAIEVIKKDFNNITIHASNSAALVGIPEARFDLARIGLMMYGYHPHKRLKNIMELKPVMTLKTKV